METTIGISKDTKKKLDKLKENKRETYEELIFRIIDRIEKN